MPYQLRTPVAFFIYKRPETTRRVFKAIAAAKPPRLFVVADGPKSDTDAPSCEAARAVVEGVNWDCEVLTDFSPVNLGLRRRVSSGLDWVFGQVEEAIILEDDCLPHPTFFRFCEDLLERYRDDPRIMHVGGNDFQRRRAASESYYFARYPHIWGWATWRHAWQFYDVDLRAWTDAPDKRVYLDQFENPLERGFWQRTWDAVAAGQIDTWDYQWGFACLSRRGLAINPSVNLVSNIGYGTGGTHTHAQNDPLANRPVQAMEFPLRHPPSVARNVQADDYTARLFFSLPTMRKRIVRRVKKVLRLR